MNLYTSKDDLSKFRQAGRITARARDFGLSLIKAGVTVLEVCEAVEEEIRRMGGEPAFPAQISLNNVAAHFCPAPKDPLVFCKGDVAKLDVGAHVDGYVGDTAASVTVGGKSLLEEASREALAAALKVIAPGVAVGEVGRVIQSIIVDMGFRPVSNLSGHAVGIYQVHGEPQIPNVAERSRVRFTKGQVLAVEPFATTGKGIVKERGLPEIFSVRGRLKMKKGTNEEVLKAVAAYNGLPFARRNLADRFPRDAVDQTLKVLLKKGVLHAYPPLAEEEGTLISQAEHTVYIGDEMEILTLPD